MKKYAYSMVEDEQPINLEKLAGAEEEKAGIPQERIMQLLKEAANLKDPTRRAAIQLELTRAATKTPNTPDFRKSSTARQKLSGQVALMNQLFVETSENRPEALPSLFPLFASMAGTRTDSGYAEINWSLMNQPSRQERSSQPGTQPPPTSL